jgi:hypothetical protein
VVATQPLPDIYEGGASFNELRSLKALEEVLRMRRLYHERLEKKAFKMGLVLQLRDLEPAERSQKIDELS